MATTKVKNIKKAEWQEIAKSYGISFTDDNEVRYLVEKIAEKIGVDDKIVKLDDLKQAVCDVIDSQGKGISESVEKTPVSDEVSKKEKVKEVKMPKPKKVIPPSKKGATSSKEKPVKTEVVIDPQAELLHYRNEAQRLGVQYGVEQGVNEIKQFLDYFCQVNPPVTYVTYEETLGIVPTAPATAPASGLSRLEELRKECEQYGVAYGSAHTEHDLEQLLTMIRGIVPINPNPPSAPQGDFELKMDNFDEVTSSAPANPTPSLTNPINTNAVNNVMQVITAKASAPSTIGINELNTYRTLFAQTIRGHFRLLFEHEVHEMLTRDRYPFNFQIKKNPNQQNQIEIILSLGGNSVRVPSEDTNDWLSING